MTAFDTIVVPHDFSDTAERAYRAACDLASESGATIHLVHVLSPPAYAFAGDGYGGFLAASRSDLGLQAGLAEATRERIERVARSARLPAERVHVHVVVASSVPQAIVSKADDLDADLIAMGTHGRTGLAHLLMGSTAEATLRNATCPVLAVPVQRAVAPRTRHWEASRHPALGAL